jgi:hypothetical protein
LNMRYPRAIFYFWPEVRPFYTLLQEESQGRNESK